MSKCSVIATIIIGCVHAFYTSTLKDINPLVTTNKGDVQGLHLLSQNGTVVYSYHGIPYAKPPVGRLRWTYPVEPESWNKTLDATAFKPRCTQADMLNAHGQTYMTSEDCLYLNVYTPEAPGSSARLPVLMMIHGGGYISGGADMFPGQGIVNNLASRGIIVVTMNYRLGPFGFLTSGDERLPGNFGLMDMIMVIQWVQDEIANFGGDPTKTTLYGVSTGAHAASILLMYPKVTEIIQQGILQSGSSLLPTSTNVTAALHSSMRLTNSLKCKDWLVAKPDVVLACARNASSSQITSAMFDDQQYWKPAASEKFLSAQLLDRPKMNMMIGVNRHEHSLFVAPERVRDDWMKELKSYADSFGKPGRPVSQYYSQIRKQPLFYGSFNETDLQESINRTLALYGIGPDSLATRIARIMYDVDDRDGSANDKLYWFKQYVKVSYKYCSPNDRCDQGWRGVRHADDQQYLMAQPGRPQGHHNFLGTSLDYRVADCFGEMVANFVKFGNPSSPECNIAWPPMYLNPDSGRVSAKYLSYGSEPIMKSQFHPRAAQFWADTAWMLADMR